MAVNKHKSLGRLSRGIHLSDSKLRRRHLGAFVTLNQIVLEADARGTYSVFWGGFIPLNQLTSTTSRQKGLVRNNLRVRRSGMDMWEQGATLRHLGGIAGRL